MAIDGVGLYCGCLENHHQDDDSEESTVYSCCNNTNTALQNHLYKGWVWHDPDNHHHWA